MIARSPSPPASQPFRLAVLLAFLLPATAAARPVAPAHPLVRHDGFLPWSWDSTDSTAAASPPPGRPIGADR